MEHLRFDLEYFVEVCQRHILAFVLEHRKDAFMLHKISKSTTVGTQGIFLRIRLVPSVSCYLFSCHTNTLRVRNAGARRKLETSNQRFVSL
jgi:hypothetical protein